MKLNIINGSKYGMLTVVCESEPKRLPSGQTNRVFECLCDCGNTTNVRLLHLIRMRTISCGCASLKMNGLSNKKIGKAYKSMLSRCSDKYFERRLYFDKGIKVCNDWQNSFSSFYEWAINNGYKDGLQLDRIDNSLGYSPDNCRFVEPYLNANNKDTTFYITYNGEKRALSLVLRELNKTANYYTIFGRIKRGWVPQDAIDKPIKEGNYIRTIL